MKDWLSVMSCFIQWRAHRMTELKTQYSENSSSLVPLWHSPVNCTNVYILKGKILLSSRHTWLWATCSSSNLQQKSLALAASKALQNCHCTSLSQHCLFGLDKWPQGSGLWFCMSYICFYFNCDYCESNNCAMLLNNRAEKLLEVPKQRSWGWSYVDTHNTHTHTPTHIWLFLSPRFVDPLVFIKDEMTGRVDFYITNVLILLTCPQVSQAPWTAITLSSCASAWSTNVKTNILDTEALLRLI